MGRVEIWARPGSSADGISWDPWRKRWTVTCRAPPSEGKANEAIRQLVAGWLGISADAVGWVVAGASRAKVLEVHGLSDPAIAQRLGHAASAHRDP